VAVTHAKESNGAWQSESLGHDQSTDLAQQTATPVQNTEVLDSFHCRSDFPASSSGCDRNPSGSATDIFHQELLTIVVHQFIATFFSWNVLYSFKTFVLVLCRGVTKFEFECCRNPTVFPHRIQQFLVKHEFCFALRNSKLFSLPGLQKSTKW